MDINEMKAWVEKNKFSGSTITYLDGNYMLDEMKLIYVNPKGEEITLFFTQCYNVHCDYPPNLVDRTSSSAQPAHFTDTNGNTMFTM